MTASHRVFHVEEIHQKARFVQALAFDHHLHAEIVAVHIFTFALVIAQRVACGEGLFY